MALRSAGQKVTKSNVVSGLRPELTDAEKQKAGALTADGKAAAAKPLRGQDSKGEWTAFQNFAPPHQQMMGYSNPEARKVRALLGQLSAHGVFHSKLFLYGVFIWAHRTLNSQSA